MRYTSLIMLGLIALLTGCVTVPQAPNVAVFKGEQKTFEQYNYDAVYCRDYASKQLGTDQESQEVKSAATAGIITAVLGTAAGAAIGAVTGSAGTGAAIGAATGAVTGTAYGTQRGQGQAMTLQMRYDQNYLVCMDAAGHHVPGR